MRIADASFSSKLRSVKSLYYSYSMSRSASTIRGASQSFAQHMGMCCVL